MKNLFSYLQLQIKSFKPALNGLYLMLKDHNSLIHVPSAVIVCGLAWLFGVSKNEWLWLLLAIFMVWIAETINTAIEKLVDLVSPQYNPLAGKVKDMAAGAVLLATIFAVTIGILIFYPYILAKIFF